MEVLVVEVLSCTIPAADVVALGTPVKSLHGRLPLKDVAVTVPVVVKPELVKVARTLPLTPNWIPLAYFISRSM
jgi:hypothetical protein